MSDADIRLPGDGISRLHARISISASSHARARPQLEPTPRRRRQHQRQTELQLGDELPLPVSGCRHQLHAARRRPARLLAQPAGHAERESALLETTGICNGVDGDWNGNGAINASSVAFDVNGDLGLTTLGDHDDWANLVYDSDGIVALRTSVDAISDCTNPAPKQRACSNASRNSPQSPEPALP